MEDVLKVMRDHPRTETVDLAAFITIVLLLSNSWRKQAARKEWMRRGGLGEVPPPDVIVCVGYQSPQSILPLLVIDRGKGK